MKIVNEHFVSATCGGELCGMCWRATQAEIPATHKIGETVPPDYPGFRGHSLTQYVCCKHFGELFGPATAHSWRNCPSGIKL